MTDDSIDGVMTRWRAFAAQVETRAEAARQTPASMAAATLEGIVPIRDDGDPFQGFSTRGRPSKPRNEKAEWLRGTAKKLIPPEFRWEVLEVVGGDAALVLLAHEPHLLFSAGEELS